jgi:hypothetical protein
MIQIYDNVLRQNKKSDKIFILWKIHIYSTIVNTQKCDILEQLPTFLITICKIFHSKILLYKKVKRIKKMIHNPFIK